MFACTFDIAYALNYYLLLRPTYVAYTNTTKPAGTSRHSWGI